MSNKKRTWTERVHEGKVFNKVSDFYLFHPFLGFCITAALVILCIACLGYIFFNSSNGMGGIDLPGIIFRLIFAVIFGYGAFKSFLAFSRGVGHDIIGKKYDKSRKKEMDKDIENRKNAKEVDKNIEYYQNLYKEYDDKAKFYEAEVEKGSKSSEGTFDENMENYKKYHKKAYEIKQIIDEKQSHVEEYISKDDNNK